MHKFCFMFIFSLTQVYSLESLATKVELGRASRDKKCQVIYYIKQMSYNRCPDLINRSGAQFIARHPLCEKKDHRVGKPLECQCLSIVSDQKLAIDNLPRAGRSGTVVLEYFSNPFDKNFVLTNKNLKPNYLSVKNYNYEISNEIRCHNEL